MQLLCCFRVFIRKTKWTCTHFFKNTWWNRNLVGGHALFQYCHRIASGWVGLPSVYKWSLAAISKVALYDLTKIQSSHLLPGATFEKSSDFLLPQSGSHLWLKCIVLLGIHSFIRNCWTSPCSIRGCLGAVVWKKTVVFFSWRGHIFSLFEMLRCYNNTVSFLQLYLMQRSKKSLASTLILTLGRTKSMTKEVPSLHRICHEIHGFLLTITAFSKSSSSSFSFLYLFGSGIPSLLAVCK